MYDFFELWMDENAGKNNKSLAACKQKMVDTIA